MLRPLVLFSEGIEIERGDFRDHALEVTGGSATRAERVDGRRDLWEISIEPICDDDASLVQPEVRSYDEAGAVCTGDGRWLSNRLMLTVAGPEQQDPDPLPDDTEEPQPDPPDDTEEPEEPQEPPSPPRNLTAVVNGDGTITLSWDSPDDNSVTGYQIHRIRPKIPDGAVLTTHGRSPRHAASSGSNSAAVSDISAVNVDGETGPAIARRTARPVPASM